MHRRIMLLAMLASLALAVASSSAQAQLPVIYNGALGFAHASPTASPPGANNWSCKPSAAHPRPVVLVHGTFEDMADNWQALSPLLYDNGYCVFALNYGVIRRQRGARRLCAPARSRTPPQNWRASSTASWPPPAPRQVDLVGHSQGGMMPRYYLKFLGGAAKVHTLVGLAPSNHGTTLDGLFTLAELLPGVQRRARSARAPPANSRPPARRS